MKKTITIIAMLSGVATAYAQGTVIFQTYQSTWNIAVWSPQIGSSLEVQGNSTTDVPAGTTVYTGVPLGGSEIGSGSFAYGNGNNYTIGLYAVPGLNQIISLLGTQDLITSVQFATNGGTGAANVINGPNGGAAGSWHENADIAIPGAGSGTAGQATVELAAWYNGGDSGTTYATYSAAVAAGVPTGVSIVTSLNGLGGPNAEAPPSVPVSLGSITSFSLSGGQPPTLPEPGTIVLGFISASAFLMRLRHKTNSK